MEEISNKEAKAMVGSVFLYTDNEGDEGLLYLAAVDFNKGLTCKLYKSTGHEDYRPEGSNIICIDVKIHNNPYDKMQKILRGVKLGRYAADRSKHGCSELQCAFE